MWDNKRTSAATLQVLCCNSRKWVLCSNASKWHVASKNGYVLATHSGYVLGKTFCFSKPLLRICVGQDILLHTCWPTHSAQGLRFCRCLLLRYQTTQVCSRGMHSPRHALSTTPSSSYMYTHGSAMRHALSTTPSSTYIYKRGSAKRHALSTTPSSTSAYPT